MTLLTGMAWPCGRDRVRNCFRDQHHLIQHGDTKDTAFQKVVELFEVSSSGILMKDQRATERATHWYKPDGLILFLYTGRYEDHNMKMAMPFDTIHQNPTNSMHADSSF